MKIAIRKGVGFGLTSGIITTLGLIIGLNSTTSSKLIIISGILTIAIADAFSDSLGVHMSEEAGSKRTKEKSVWESTIATFLSKLFFALTFLIPFIMFSTGTAVLISIIWGLSLITIFSFYIAKKHNVSPIRAVAEHLFITVIVIILANFTGLLIKSLFSV